MHPFLNTIFPAVRKGAAIMMSAIRDVKSLQVSDKGVYDYVTEIDRTVEAILIDTIREAYPTHGIVGEESGQIEGETYTWIIDPLDGTKNFVHGFPHFCISIAITNQNRLEHALIYDPVRDELFTAKRGNGAKLNNQKLRVTELPSLKHALLATAIPTMDRPFFQEYMAGFTKLYPAVSGIRQCGSGALNLAYVAAGRVDGHFEMGLKSWDIAAGALLVQEAGGLVGDFQGGTDYLQSGQVIAANPKVFKEMLQAFHAARKG